VSAQGSWLDTVRVSCVTPSGTNLCPGFGVPPVHPEDPGAEARICSASRYWAVPPKGGICIGEEDFDLDRGHAALAGHHPCN
jgi:hypothetical protein